MAKSDLTLRVDEFFTQTRIHICSTSNCVNRVYGGFDCNLKEIDIVDGKCQQFMENEDKPDVPVPLGPIEQGKG